MPRHLDLSEPLVSLLADPVRRQSSGWPPSTGSGARFASAVVGDALERLLAGVANRKAAATT